MSIHKSLAPKNMLARSRNVLTRVERLAILQRDGRWKGDQNSIFGLPKVRVAKPKAKRK
ncbi:MAG: small basic protein [Planctomycetota bacterium]